LARELGLNLRLPKSQAASAHRRPGEPGCDWPWRSAYLNLDGTVQPCCMLLAATPGTDGQHLRSADQPDLEVRTGLLGPDPPPSAPGHAAVPPPSLTIRRSRLGRTVAGKTEGVSVGAAIVVALGAVAVLFTVAWFVVNRKHPESGASHSEPPRTESSMHDGEVQDRPAGPGAEADGVAGPGQPTLGETYPRA
jgi:hypothetical protein